MYQRNLLDMMFLGDSANRNKYVVVMADSIQPRLPAAQYLDGAEFELEFKQIVGDIFLCEDVGKSLIVIGKDGLLLVGKQAPEHEAILVHFINVQAREQFIRSLFFRIFVLIDTLKKIRQLILQVQHARVRVPLFGSWRQLQAPSRPREQVWSSL